jgi:hypothetical protein
MVLLAAALVPGPGPRVERNPAQDQATVKRTECEYRGITAPFEELTRAYALSVYERPELLRWESEPSPQDPEREALVTAVFAVSGPKGDAQPAPPEAVEARRRAAPAFGVTWRLSTLAATRVTAANDYARDALLVYQQTVNHFISQMVVTTAAGRLRAGPGREYAESTPVAAGAVLLEERREGDWCLLRVPGSDQTGWLEAAGVSRLGSLQP